MHDSPCRSSDDSKQRKRRFLIDLVRLRLQRTRYWRIHGASIGGKRSASEALARPRETLYPHNSDDTPRV